MNHIKYNVSKDPIDYCKKNLKYRAEVIFRLATDSLSVTVMSRRLSFFDKMSAFGKLMLKIIYCCEYYTFILRFFVVTGGILGLCKV